MHIITYLLINTVRSLVQKVETNEAMTNPESDSSYLQTSNVYKNSSIDRPNEIRFGLFK